MKIDLNAAIMFFMMGFAVSSAVDYTMNRHKHEVIKTNIGEFIIHDGKIFSVYEMQRNINGDMVGR